jgi:translation initiation factor IF-3
MKSQGIKKTEEHKTNSSIKEHEVRLVDLPDGYENRVYKIDVALRMAEELDADLILISDKVRPVICKIMEYSKFKYDKKKKEKDLKKKTSVLKELKFSPDIAENDLIIKSKKAIEFLSEGNKVRVTIQFKGRGIVFKDRGTIVLLKLAELVQEVGVPESMPELSGKRMSFTLKPKK